MSTFTADVEPPPSSQRISRGIPLGVFVGVLVVAVTPIVVATVRALARGWMPVSENALFALRAHDVFTPNMPLLGTASSVSTTSARAVNHPGPLVFDWLALPVRLLGGNAGVAVGVALLNIAAIVIAGLFARRVAGEAVAVAVLLGAGFIAWVMGSELLFDPWNPHVLMLPAYAFVVIAWTLANGGTWSLPWLALFGSLCLETHLSYVYLIPIVTIGAAIVGATVPSLPTVRQLQISGAVLLFAWLFPIVEQVQHGRDGNLWGLARAGFDSDSPTIGFGLATRLTAAVLTRAPWSARGGFITAVPATPYANDGRLPAVDTVGAAAAGIRLGLLVAVLVGLWLWGRRRDQIVGRTAAFTLVVVGAAWFSVSRMPIGAIGLSPHQMRWLWVVAGWLVAVAGLTVIRLTCRVAGREAATIVVAVVAGLLVVVSALNLGQFVQPAGPAIVAWRIPSVKSLTDQTIAAVQASPPTGPLWVDTTDIPYFDAYYQPLMAAFGEAGIEFQVDDPVQLRQVGPLRELTRAATVRVHLLYGAEALAADDATIVARVGTTPDDAVVVIFNTIDDEAGS